GESAAVYSVRADRRRPAAPIAYPVRPAARAAPERPMESWSIDIQKEYFKFSAAHFLIFPDGTAERLHGHNYRVYAEIDAALSRPGLVLDFKQVKPLIRRLVDELDEHWLVPGQHDVLRVSPLPEGRIEVRFRERVYAAPTEDVLVLPVNNISAENLATH